MNSKNLPYILAKAYIASHQKMLSSCLEAATLKGLWSKLMKYEDISYLKDAYTPDVLAHIEEEVSRRQEWLGKLDDLSFSLNKFYKDHFDGKEILDIPAIRNDLKELDKQLQGADSHMLLFDASPLYEFRENLENELSVYISYHKKEEYMDMEEFRRSVRELLDGVNALLHRILESVEMENSEYVHAYLQEVERQFGVYFENRTHGLTRLPKGVKGLLFCLPWIIGFFVFTLYPLIQTLIFSFSSVTLSPEGFKTELIGFTNYFNLFSSDTDFILALENYLIEMVIYVPLITVFSLMLAMLLNTSIRGRAIFRTIFFFPVVITSGPVIKLLLEQGVTAMPGVNSLIDFDALLANAPALLQRAFNILTSDFIMILWFSGIQILVFLTALQKIDKSVYEASAIDGASRWEQFWKVTLPALNPTIVINVVFTVVMQSIFALNPIILKIQSDMNDTSEGKGYGYSAALAFTYFLVMILVLLLFVFIFKKHNRKGKKGR